MSESDDTDVLLMIPPDFFLVPSSDSEDSDYRGGKSSTGVVSELIEHVQSLESRITAIESKDNSLDASLLSASLDSYNNHLPRVNGFVTDKYPSKSTSKNPSSLHNSPVKALRSSLIIPERCNGKANVINTNSSCASDKHALNKVDALHDKCETMSRQTNRNSRNSPGESNFNNKPLRRCSNDKKKKMELPEVDKLLKDMEATEIELAKRIRSSSRPSSSTFKDQSGSFAANGDLSGYHQVDHLPRRTSPLRKLDFQSPTKSLANGIQIPNFKQLTSHLPDLSLPVYEDSLQTVEAQDALIDLDNDSTSDKEAMSEKKLKTSVFNDLSPIKRNYDITSPLNSPKGKKPHSVFSNEDSIHTSTLRKTGKSASEQFTESRFKTPMTDEMRSAINEMHSLPSIRTASNTDKPRKPQTLLALSDFWEENGGKTYEETFRIRIEEEKFRREHCEKVIQELQKKLLEQQEKVAVAIRVDNEKNSVISQFHNAWSKLKERWRQLEEEHGNLQKTLDKVNGKHQLEISEFQAQVKRLEGEMSKALDLAAGYKEKSDSTIKEKLDLLKEHADELINYKSLVEQAEARNDNVKSEYNRMCDKNHEFEETLRKVQQDLNKECLRNSEVRNEMAVIHKALDACEAELTILRQEKESLQLKLKEEVNRNSLLEQNKASLLATIEDVQKAERAAKEEVKSLSEQQDKIKSSLRDVYQKQVDEVVKTKLHEFQSQLDAAEVAFQSELETRERTIAECAARKIKSIIDKHQLEINLLEEKHKEEKRLGKIQLAHAMQKLSMLESKLNMQSANKTLLAEQLHSVMQKQWQQALQIISGENADSSVSKNFDNKQPKKSESLPNCYTKNILESIQTHAVSVQNLQTSLKQEDESLITSTSADELNVKGKKEPKEDLRQYIKELLEMQQSKSLVRKNFFKQSTSPTPICREVPRKYYTKQDFMSEDVNWQPVSEDSTHDHDISEYMPMFQNQIKGDQRNKPPWK